MKESTTPQPAKCIKCGSDRRSIRLCTDCYKMIPHPPERITKCDSSWHVEAEAPVPTPAQYGMCKANYVHRKHPHQEMSGCVDWKAEAPVVTAPPSTTQFPDCKDVEASANDPEAKILLARDRESFDAGFDAGKDFRGAEIARMLESKRKVLCRGCLLGKPLTRPPHSSVVGGAAIHTPEGWVCVADLALEAIGELRALAEEIAPTPQK